MDLLSLFMTWSARELVTSVRHFPALLQFEGPTGALDFFLPRAAVSTILSALRKLAKAAERGPSSLLQTGSQASTALSLP